jgi:hypothetical protein
MFGSGINLKNIKKKEGAKNNQLFSLIRTESPFC